MADSYDVAVLGGGPGGYAAALRAAQRGANVCCIEAGQIGGTCLNVGCIPTKALLYAAELRSSYARAKQFGLGVDEAPVDGPAVMARVHAVTDRLRKGVEGLLKARQVAVFRGRGRLTSPHGIEIDEGPDAGKRVDAGATILATGSRPVRPGFLPFSGGRVWTTDEAIAAESLPRSVVIVGGGVIGCEFATAWAELGVRVTLVEMLDRLAGVMPADASRAIGRSLKKRRVDVRLGAKIVSARETDSGIAVEMSEEASVEAERVLACVGRVPNVEGIGLEDLGVRLEDGLIAADDQCRTNVDNIYAVGDVAERRQYAHLASRMGAIAADNATGHEARDDRTVVPVGVYTHPQAACVGLSRQQASDAGRAVRAAKFPLGASGLANVQGEVEGSVELVADESDGRVLGGLIIAHNATDLIQEIALAIRHELTIEDVARAIHPHPTLVEAVGEAAESWLGLPLHALR